MVQDQQQPADDLSRAAAKVSSGLQSGLSIARDGLIVCGIFFYFLGFTYYNQFLSAFGIAIDYTDFPIYQLFLYAYAVFQRDTGFFTAVAAAIVIFILLGLGFEAAVLVVLTKDAWPDRERIKVMRIVGFCQRLIQSLGIVIAVLGVVYFGYHAAIAAADKDANALRAVAGGAGGAGGSRWPFFGLLRPAGSLVISPTITSTHFELTKSALATLPTEFQRANCTGLLRIVAQSKDLYHVIVVPNPGNVLTNLLRGGPGTVYTVKKRHILYYSTSTGLSRAIDDPACPRLLNPARH